MGINCSKGKEDGAIMDDFVKDVYFVKARKTLLLVFNFVDIFSKFPT